jgi:hypothetical protein
MIFQGHFYCKRRVRSSCNPRIVQIYGNVTLFHYFQQEDRDEQPRKHVFQLFMYVNDEEISKCILDGVMEALSLVILSSSAPASPSFELPLHSIVQLHMFAWTLYATRTQGSHHFMVMPSAKNRKICTGLTLLRS